jgi:hypothetical protein
MPHSKMRIEATEQSEVDEQTTPTQQATTTPQDVNMTEAAATTLDVAMLLRFISEQQAENRNLMLKLAELQNNSNKQSSSLKPFKMPNISAPDFDGSSVTRKAEVARVEIDDYLFKAENLCKKYNFLGDDESPTFVNQVTYVRFIA